ncbi:class I SAM-dependent methyltransferase [Streptomyces roseolus]|uniref:class I SAM-dependent methyltransferase n=1 Tax=Streptomyces roseolus TaxID=67358 RepID=UPI003658AAA6
MIDQFYERRSAWVRLVDDRTRASIESGAHQVVVLGAGLGTRAFRLSMPADLVWFELDQPEIFAFKEPVLQRLSPRSACHRHTVPVDLRSDWAGPLIDSGFQQTVPTTWIEEGVLGYLPHDKAISLAATITELSALGSTFSTSHLEVDEHHPPLPRAEEPGVR